MGFAVNTGLTEAGAATKAELRTGGVLILTVWTKHAVVSL
jgi:hypothetical protein